MLDVGYHGDDGLHWVRTDVSSLPDLLFGLVEPPKSFEGVSLGLVFPE